MTTKKMTVAQISKLRGIPKSTVSFAIIKYKRTDSLNRPVGSGRKCESEVVALLCVAAPGLSIVSTYQGF